MSDTSVVFGSCFKCGRPITGSCIILGSERYHHGCVELTHPPMTFSLNPPDHAMCQQQVAALEAELAEEKKQVERLKRGLTITVGVVEQYPVQGDTGLYMISAEELTKLRGRVGCGIIPGCGKCADCQVNTALAELAAARAHETLWRKEAERAGDMLAKLDGYNTSSEIGYENAFEHVKQKLDTALADRDEARAHVRNHHKEACETCAAIEGELEAARAALQGRSNRPTIVCLCGSTRFKDEFVAAGLRETLDGKIVLTIGCNMRTDQEIFGHLSPDELFEIKRRLDVLHFRKIELADEVLILNVGGYIGESTRNELGHALKLGKRVRWLEPDNAKAALGGAA